MVFELIVGVAVGAGLGHNTGCVNYSRTIIGAYFPSRVRPCFEPLVTESRRIGIHLRDKVGEVWYA